MTTLMTEDEDDADDADCADNVDNVDDVLMMCRSVACSL